MVDGSMIVVARRLIGKRRLIGGCKLIDGRRLHHSRVVVELEDNIIRSCRHIGISTVTYSFHFSDHTIEVVHPCGDLAAGYSEESLEVLVVVILYYVRMCCGSLDQTELTVSTKQKLKIGSCCMMGAGYCEMSGCAIWNRD